MPTIVDSLFLELGIDVSKFSKDQQAALAKIKQFESETKRAAGNARGGIATVGEAFRDLARDSRLGSSTAQVENLADKFKALGMSLQVSGGAGSPIGGMAKGLGMLLSPAAMGAAAIGLLAKEAWDFNREMSDANATLARNAQLSGMSATNLWALGQAVKTVGGNAEGVEASIAGLQTSLAGMSIGAGSNVQALIGMARLRQYGAKFNPGGFGNGVDEESLFKAVTKMSQEQGKARTMALVTQYGLMNQDQANLAMSAGGWDEYQKTLAKAKAMKTGGGFENVVRNSLKSQAGLGENDIEGSIAAQTAYGGIQQPMQTTVGLLTDIRAFVSSILNFIMNPKKAYDSTVDAASRNVVEPAMEFGKKAESFIGGLFEGPVRKSMRSAMTTLMGNGISKDDAAAMVGSFMQESSMNPLAKNASGHVGLMQWDKSRQAAFAKQYGYQMGSDAQPGRKQFEDQVMFAAQELQTTHKIAASQMKQARSLMDKTSAFMQFGEVVNDNSLNQRFKYASIAEDLSPMLGALSAINSTKAGAVHQDNRSETHIGDVHLHTPSTDPKSHADAFLDGIWNHPLIDPSGQAAVSLATRGMTG